MATKTQVDQAAKKKYGKDAFLGWRKESSSSAKRAAAQAKRNAAKQRLDNAVNALKAIKPTFIPLIEAARFVIDTDGDRTALSQLNDAVIAAEHERELREEKNAASVEKQATEYSDSPHYYQYQIGIAQGAGGLRYTLVKHQADTLAEIIELLKNGDATPPSPK